MSTDESKPGESRPPIGGPGRPVSRRRFLAGAGTLAAVGLTGPQRWSAWLAPAQAEPISRSSGSLSRVVEVRSNHVVLGFNVHPGLLREMVVVGLQALTEQPDEKRAWRALLSPDDVIGLKFNSSGASGLGVTPAMVRSLVASLTESGWDAGQVVPIEIDSQLSQELGTAAPRRDWLGEDVSFGSGQDRLSGVLDQVTAIVNVPFLKHHNIAGITGCLKNLSHALVKHPARYHDNKCCPYIGDIVALPQIRQKLRLNIVNALRIVIDQGPEVQAGCTTDCGMLLLGVDPVALDSMGLEILNRVRLSEGLGKIEDHQGEVTYLPAAAASGLGRCRLHEIDVVRHRL